MAKKSCFDCIHHGICRYWEIHGRLPPGAWGVNNYLSDLASAVAAPCEAFMPQLPDGRVRYPRPTIVCLCGSTRFYEAWQEANYEMTMAGKIVLTVGFYGHAPDANPHQARVQHGELVGCTPEQKLELDELHKRKIELADEVYVINVNGYIGASTRSEILYAMVLEKPITFLDEEAWVGSPLYHEIEDTRS